MDFIHSTAEALRTTFSPSKSGETATELRATLGEGMCVCIVGNAPNELSRAVATKCSEALGSEAIFVTAGQDSAHSFADWCTSEVFHLIPTWDSTGFRGTDLAMGTDLQDCCNILGTLGDVFVVFPGAEPDVLKKASDRSRAILPLLNAEPSVPKPWFVTEDQWKLFCDPDAPTAKVAAACAAALTSFDAHHKAVTEPELCDELCYVDADAERWAQLAEVAQTDVPDVAKGKLRLQGNFQGTATTHTHQMDLRVGVNMEMPSKVAAKTMKQLSDSGLVPTEAQEALESKRRGVFGALADYFGKDSQDAPDVSSMIMNSMQMKLDDVHAAYEAQQEELQHALEAARAEASSMRQKLKELQEANEANAAKEVEQDLKTTNGTDVNKDVLDELQSRVAIQDAELALKAKELEAAISSYKADMEEQQRQAAKDFAALNRLETALIEAHGNLEVLEQEKAALNSELNELKASHARACGELESLRVSSPSGRREAEATLQDKQQECEGLAQKLAVAEAVSRDTMRRLEELEAQLSQLAGREAEAKARVLEASNQLEEKTAETERLRAENQEIRETLAKITMSERRLSSTVAELSERLSASTRPQTRSSSGSINKELQQQHQKLQAEHENCLKSLDVLQGERANWQKEMESLKLTCSQLRKEADQAKTCLAAEIAGKAASVAQVAHEKEVATGLKKALAEAQHHSAQASSESTLLASKIKDLETKLQDVESEASERAQELSRAAGEESESAELRRQLKQAVEEQLQALEKAKVWQQHLQAAQGQIADLTSELEALRKSKEGAEERIMAATRELSEEENSLSLTASEDRQLRSRPGASRSVIVRSIATRSGQLNVAKGAPVTTYKSMAVPQAMQGGRRTGKVTHIGTTTTIGNVSVFSPSEAALGTPLGPCSGAALPVATAPPFTQVTNVMTRASIPAAPVASLQLPTTAGLVHGQIGIQIGTVRRIR